MPISRKVASLAEGRLFMNENGAGPASPFVYQTLAKAGGLSKDLGSVDPVRIPDPFQYNQFQTIGSTRGQQGLPEFSLEALARRSLSKLYSAAERGCPIDLHLHYGACDDPSDFNRGWDMGWIIEGAGITSYSQPDSMAMDGDENGPVMETADVTAERMYQIVNLLASELAASQITDPIIAVRFVGSVVCGACGLPNDGTQVFILVGSGVVGSPGLQTEYQYTVDGGLTFTTGTVTSMTTSEVATDAEQVGSYFVVISGGTDDDLHVALLSDILSGSPSWTAVTAGVVAAGSPTRIESYDAAHTWIVGAAGYVYFTRDILAGVEVQDAGVATAQNLLALSVFDEQSALAVGASNAVIFTLNGVSWQSVTGPVPGVDMTACEMRSTTEWFVGTNGGALYYTRNAGQTWTLKAFAGSGSGKVEDIRFVTKNVGYMSHSTTAPAGRVFRTIDGGNSWYPLPEQAGVTIPTVDRFYRLGVPKRAPAQLAANIVVAGGLGANGTDGVAVALRGT